MMLKIQSLLLLAMVGLATAGFSPTSSQMMAFQDLYSGHTQWPVWRVDDNAVNVDGVVNDDEWRGAHPIFLSGEAAWNSTWYSNQQGWTGPGDFIALFRVLYDNTNLYVSVVYYDDKHVEGSSATSEPWIYNDALELTVLPVDFNYDKLLQFYEKANAIASQIANPELPSIATRVNRRFTAIPGLVGWKDGIRYPGSMVEMGWRESEPEGSSNLGGIVAAAGPYQDFSTHLKFRGTWAMELKIPLSLLARFNTDGVRSADFIPQIGNTFKMNFTLSDDDDPLPKLNDKVLMWAGTERYSAAWWSDLHDYAFSLPEGWISLLYSPTFVFAGFKDNGGNFDLRVDEYNLYLGHDTAYYLSFINDRTFLSNVSKQHAGGLGLWVSPNPIAQSGQLQFFLPASGAAQVEIYNLSGARVATVGDGHWSAGFHTLAWDGTDRSGARVSPGLYAVRLITQGKVVTKQVTLLK